VIAIPAVDLKGGACVQLVGGSFADERVRIADPVAVSQKWIDAGFRRLHVVDLDAAVGSGNNAREVGGIIQLPSLMTQVGGGVRSTERVTSLLELGAMSVVVGTRAVDDPAWLDEIAERFPARVMVAADVRERCITANGWTRERDIDIAAFIARIDDLPLAGILVTAVHREGQMNGTDLPLITEVVEATRLPVVASGGIASVAELRELATRGVSAAVLGMSLYTGALDARAIAQEFPS
jgi:phosphoribosylformimino-5-aminoimidazole carboxamide ribotide isomerase